MSIFEVINMQDGQIWEFPTDLIEPLDDTDGEEYIMVPSLKLTGIGACWQVALADLERRKKRERLDVLLAAAKDEVETKKIKVHLKLRKFEVVHCFDTASYMYRFIAISSPNVCVEPTNEVMPLHYNTTKNKNIGKFQITHKVGFAVLNPGYVWFVT